MSPTISPAATRIAWIGTGVMGARMAGHLLQAGYRLTVFNRTPAKAAPLVDQGARWADSPAEAVREADLVFTIVSKPDDVREVYLGKHGLLDACQRGVIAVDMTTSEPALAVEIYDRARAGGVSTVDAPVSGGDVGARNATLSIMIGGEEQTIEVIRPCLELLGKTIVRQGPAGTGQHAKMVNQILIATGIIGVCEALLYAYRAGLNLETVLKSVSGGAAGSWSLANYGPRILVDDFAPGFSVDHFLKDLRIALREAERLQLSLPGLALGHQLYVALQAQGGGKLGIHGLQLALARLSAIDWSAR